MVDPYAVMATSLISMNSKNKEIEGVLKRLKDGNLRELDGRYLNQCTSIFFMHAKEVRYPEMRPLIVKVANLTTSIKQALLAHVLGSLLMYIDNGVDDLTESHIINFYNILDENEPDPDSRAAITNLLKTIVTVDGTGKHRLHLVQLGFFDKVVKTMESQNENQFELMKIAGRILYHAPEKVKELAKKAELVKNISALMERKVPFCTDLIEMLSFYPNWFTPNECNTFLKYDLDRKGFFSLYKGLRSLTVYSNLSEIYKEEGWVPAFSELSVWVNGSIQNILGFASQRDYNCIKNKMHLDMYLPVLRKLLSNPQFHRYFLSNEMIKSLLNAFKIKGLSFRNRMHAIHALNQLANASEEVHKKMGGRKVVAAFGGKDNYNTYRNVISVYEDFQLANRARSSAFPPHVVRLVGLHYFNQFV